MRSVIRDMEAGTLDHEIVRHLHSYHINSLRKGKKAAKKAARAGLALKKELGKDYLKVVDAYRSHIVDGAVSQVLSRSLDWTLSNAVVHAFSLSRRNDYISQALLENARDILYMQYGDGYGRIIDAYESLLIRDTVSAIQKGRLPGELGIALENIILADIEQTAYSAQRKKESENWLYLNFGPRCNELVQAYAEGMHRNMTHSLLFS